jgi:hypothetical protein
MFSRVVLVNGRPECSLSLTDVRLSLKAFVPEKSFALAHGVTSEGFL